MKGTKLPENYKEIMIDCGKSGQTNQYFFKLLRIGHTTHFDLLKENEEYAKAYEEYKEHHEAYWLDKARQAILQGEDFNTKKFFLMMGNKHRQKWKNHAKTKDKGEGI